MCYNKDISIYTYLIGLVSSYLLIVNDKISLKILGCFFMIVIQMQLIDYFLWTNNTCNSKNIQISTIGAFINFIQPIQKKNIQLNGHKINVSLPNKIKDTLYYRYGNNWNKKSRHWYTLYLDLQRLKTFGYL